MKRSVIFGGTGFIGTHLAQSILQRAPSENVVLVDLLPPRQANYASILQDALKSGRATFTPLDVRKRIEPQSIGGADVIYNLAAVHREPGHLPHEYYETNLLGAENVCEYAAAVKCSEVVFTSSISPYGPTEDSKTEASLPVPESPYGGSKLAAEKIHIAWQKANADRKLLIVRPGVVFGPGEGGNVTRLVRSLVKGYFVYMGNRDTRKAGGYVKELCEVIRFGQEHQESSGEACTVLNFSMDPPRPLSEFVEVIRKVAEIRSKPLSVPRSLLLGSSYVIDGVARTFGIRQPISPVRIRKLYRSTNIEPKRLRDLNYVYRYSLEEAFVDWKRDNPEDFAKNSPVKKQEVPRSSQVRAAGTSK